MNLANKLTLLRIALVPFFVVFLSLPADKYTVLWALVIFIAASLTDFADGHIARSRGMITDLGKFMDPLADKILVMAALVCFVCQGWVQPWVVIVILTREFAVSGIRMIAAGKSDKVIAAGWLGKLKTASTMIAIIVIMALEVLEGFGVEIAAASLISDVLMYICVFLTVLSGAAYFWTYRGVFRE